MTLYKATIQVGGPHGKNAKVQLDGEVEVEADVRFRALIARTGQHPTRWLIGEGDSPKAAIADLLSKLP